MPKDKDMQPDSAAGRGQSHQPPRDTKPALKPQPVLTPQPKRETKSEIEVQPTMPNQVTKQPIPAKPTAAKKQPANLANENQNQNQNKTQNSNRPTSQNQRAQPKANQPEPNVNPNVNPNVKPNLKPESNPKPSNGPVRGGEGAAGMRNVKSAQANRTIPRPESWEDDISRNTLDDTPFTSLPSPASRQASDFEEASRHQAMKPLLGGTPIGQFVKKDSWPIPTPEDREGYSAGFDENYWISGLEDYLKIMKIAKQQGVIARSVLDFGCATGRVVRHFAAQSDIPEVWATDINQRHVRWLYEHMPHSVKPVFNHCIPTLPIADGSVDIITAFSVFTHIDTFETHWLAELSRIMSDGGMCYLTVHNEDTWEALRKEKDNEKNRLIQSIVKIDPNFKQLLMEPMPDKRTIYRFTQSGPYRAQVFHSNNYLRKVWGRFFDIETIMPCHHVRQTVVVLRKKRR